MYNALDENRIFDCEVTNDYYKIYWFNNQIALHAKIRFSLIKQSLKLKFTHAPFKEWRCLLVGRSKTFQSIDFDVFLCMHNTERRAGRCDVRDAGPKKGAAHGWAILQRRAAAAGRIANSPAQRDWVPLKGCSVPHELQLCRFSAAAGRQIRCRARAFWLYAEPRGSDCEKYASLCAPPARSFVRLTERNPLVRSQTKLAKFMFPRLAGQAKPAGVQRVCACLSVFFHFGDMKGAARIYIYTPPSCLIYIQSRGARPARRYFTCL